MSKATRNPDLFPPPTSAQAIDPDFQGQQHYSKWCGRGSIIVVHPDTHEITITPLRCGSWTCHYCGRRKSGELRLKIKRAKPNRFVTLTCAHPGDSTPAQAEYAMRKGWTKFVKRLRKTCPELEYFRVVEWQSNGWPHFHVLLRCEYLPKKILEDAWHKYCWPGFVDIKLIKHHQGIPDEVTKYIIKAYKIAEQLDKHERLFCSSKDFFPPAAARDDEDDDPNRLWCITTLTPDDLRSQLQLSHWNYEQCLDDDAGYKYRGYATHWRALLPQLLERLESLPWYNTHNNNLPHAPPALRLPVAPSGPAQMTLLMPSPEQLSRTIA